METVTSIKFKRVLAQTTGSIVSSKFGKNEKCILEVFLSEEQEGGIKIVVIEGQLNNQARVEGSGYQNRKGGREQHYSSIFEFLQDWTNIVTDQNI